jgi:hypothetical protein
MAADTGLLSSYYKCLLCSSGEGFWNATPLLLSNVIFVDIDIISKSVQVSAKHQGGVHERTRIDEFAFVRDSHFLDVEYEASIEDLLSNSALSSENDDFVISDLV